MLPLHNTQFKKIANSNFIKGKVFDEDKGAWTGKKILVANREY